jgi:spermidine/putrescine transport system substrate-binding protein
MRIDLLNDLDRRQFLAASGALGGSLLLAGCGGAPEAPEAPAAKEHPPIEQEDGKLSVLEWGGYEAKGTKAQKSGLEGGGDYTKEFGAKGLSYTYIVNDDQSLQKSANSGPFDVMHPCNQMVPSYVEQGLIQPWDPELLPSFKNLNPALVEAGKVDGKQYFIPWDWGYASLLYRTDKVDAADAESWDLAWNEKYKGKISLWDGAGSTMEMAALKNGFGDQMDDMTDEQIEQCKQDLIKQKPLNKFYWKSEYGQMQPAFKSGDIWITYSWQAAYVIMKEAGLKVKFMQPKEGRLAWVCGFTLGSQTKNYHHAHKYVESYINHKASLQMLNLFYYGAADATITRDEVDNKELAEELKIGDPKALESSDVHLQAFQPRRNLYQQAWQEVTAS